jgi:DNA-binding MarR family transcriptional regulator
MTMGDLEKLVRANHAIFMLTSDRISAVIATHGLTFATAQALWAIDPQEPAPSMSTMAARLFCNAPNLSFIAGQLAARGLVERIVDPADKRSRMLQLTQRGVSVRADVIRVTLDETPFAQLSASQRAALVKLMDAVVGEQ